MAATLGVAGSGGTKWFPQNRSDASVIAYLFRIRVEANPNKQWRAISENCLLQDSAKNALPNGKL